MALFNSDGEYIRVNSALCHMLGRPAEELHGRRDQEITHPDDRDADVAAAWEILEGRRGTHHCEKRFLHADGSIVWVIANLTFLRDHAGRR
jgi:PAS domain S-box-containing protein